MTDTTGLSRHPDGPAPAASVSRKALLGAVLFGAAVALSLSWALSGHPSGVPAPAPARPGLDHDAGQVVVPPDSPFREAIDVAPVRLDPVSPLRLLPATVDAEPADVVTVLPPLGGRVVSVLTLPGATVRTGQVLVRIDSGDMAQARSDAAKADAQLELTRHALARATGLGQIGGGAVKDTESARNDLAQAQAEAARAHARLAALLGPGGLQADAVQPPGEGGLVVTAPIDGQVSAVDVSAGSYINDPTQPLLTINRTGSVQITAMASEDDLASVHAGQPVAITFPAWPGVTRHAVVQSVDPVVQPDTRRSKVRIRLANPDGRLHAGMFANVAIDAVPAPGTAGGPTLGAAGQVSVPDAALLMNNDNTTVLVETAPWHFVRRVVQTGADRDGRTTILSGLAAGDRVVVRGGVLFGD